VFKVERLELGVQDFRFVVKGLGFKVRVKGSAFRV
jgi:hypothetical protein